jgi:hypothetical protein
MYFHLKKKKRQFSLEALGAIREFSSYGLVFFFWGHLYKIISDTKMSLNDHKI